MFKCRGGCLRGRGGWSCPPWSLWGQTASVLSLKLHTFAACQVWLSVGLSQLAKGKQIAQDLPSDMHLVKCLLSVSECNVKESITSLPRFFPYKVFSFMRTFQRVYLRRREYFCACGSPKPSFTSLCPILLLHRDLGLRTQSQGGSPLPVCARVAFPLSSVPAGYLNSPEDTQLTSAQ